MSLAVSVELENNPQYGVVVSSRKVAQGLSRQHKNVVRDLDKILESSDLSSLKSREFGSLKNCDIKANIIPATYTVANQKRKYREYLLTKDGFTLYMFNIQGYNDFKWAYIQKFNEMEATLGNVSKPVQQQLPMDAPMPVRKTFRGVPVMTTGDFDRITNDNIGAHLTHNCRVNWMELPMAATGMILKEFRNENRHTRVAAAGKLYLLYENDVRRLMHHFHLTADEDFLCEYFGTEPKKETVTVLPSNDDMRFAVRQADLLFSIAKEIKDPFIKEMNLKAVSALLMNVGLWSENDGTLTVSLMENALSDAREKYPRP